MFFKLQSFLFITKTLEKRLSVIVEFKGVISNKRSAIICKLKCNCCNTNYNRECQRYLMRAAEHLDNIGLTDKRVMETVMCYFDNFSIFVK